MAALNAADVLGLEIEAVRPDVPVLFERDDLFWSGVGVRTDVQWVSSRDCRVPLNLRPGGKTGYYNPAGGAFGRGSGSVYDKATLSVVNLKDVIEWQQSVELSTDSKRKAVLDAVKKELAVGMDEFRRHIESYAMGAGDGVIATVSSVTIAGGPNGGDLIVATDAFGAKLVRFNDNVSVFSSTLATNRTPGSERTVTFLDLPTKTIEISPSLATIVAGDKLVASGLTATPPVGLLGIEYHYDSAATGTWLGLNRATVPEIRANRVNAGGAFALPFPRLAMNKMGDRAGQTESRSSGAVAWMHPCQAQAYEELGQLAVLINKKNSDEGLDLYFGDDMQLAGCPVKQSFCWNKTRIDFVIKSIWGRVQQKSADFYEVGGDTVFPVVASDGGLAAAKQSILVANFNLFIDNPTKATYIDNLTVPSGY
jgi:hypothetical protein